MPAASHPHKSCAVGSPQQPSSCTTHNHWLPRSGFLPSPSAVSSAKLSPEPKPSKRCWQCHSSMGRKNRACRPAEEKSSAVEQHNSSSAFPTGTSPQLQHHSPTGRQLCKQGRPMGIYTTCLLSSSSHQRIEFSCPHCSPA